MQQLQYLHRLTDVLYCRYHPSLNIFYCCSEDITKDNSIAAFAVSPATGKLTHIGTQSAMGKSTCMNMSSDCVSTVYGNLMLGYLTIDCNSRHLLFVNYWDSVIGSIALTPSGKLGQVVETLAPPTPVVARDIEDHLNNRRIHHGPKNWFPHCVFENRPIGTTCACNCSGSLLF